MTFGHEKCHVVYLHIFGHQTGTLNCFFASIIQVYERSDNSPYPRCNTATRHLALPVESRCTDEYLINPNHEYELLVYVNINDDNLHAFCHLHYPNVLIFNIFRLSKITI